MAAAATETLELRNLLFAAPRGGASQQASRTLIGFALLLFVLLALLVAFGASSDIDWREFARKLLAKLADKPLAAILLPVVFIVLSVLPILYVGLARWRERLILTESTIEYRSPLPAPLEALLPGWKLRWDEVNRARLRSRGYARGPMALMLELSSLRGTRRVVPWLWIEANALGTSTPAEVMQASRGLDGPDALRATLDSPVMRYAAARLARVETDAPPEQAIAGYALERNPRTLAAMLLLFALIGYAITDTVLNADAYAGTPPFNLFIGWGVLGGGIVWVWLRAGDVPLFERGALAVLLAGAIGCALHPALLRANALTDPDGPRTYQYRLLEDLTLAPPEAGLPPLDFRRYREYWQQFRPGSRHPIILRQGALDFYQVDMAPLRERMRAYYERRR